MKIRIQDTTTERVLHVEISRLVLKYKASKVADFVLDKMLEHDADRAIVTPI